MKVIFVIFSIIFLTSYPNEVLLASSNCDVDSPLEDLVWLKEIKTGFEQSASVTKKQILQYLYKNESVFLIDSCSGCSDNLTTVYNCEGNVFCEFGGVAGVNSCSDFDEEATLKMILYEN